MQRRSRLAILGLAATLAPAGISPAAVIHYGASLSGPGENPANASAGTGQALVDVDTVAHTLHLHVDFAGLTGNTTASHIHAPATTSDPNFNAPNPTFGVATTTPTFAGFPLGVTSGTYDITLDLTQSSSFNNAYVTASGGSLAQAESNLLDVGLATGRAYLNIHTTAFPGGEIRGFLAVVPEPASAALLTPLVLLVLRRRARRTA